MRNKIVLLSALSAVLALFAGGAQAQITEDALDFVGELAGEPPRNGHDKCKGKGHGNGNGGGGHEEGECDEEGEGGEAPGPVATEACYAGEQAPESAWQRYSCTLVTYAEDYSTDTATALEGYPQVLVMEAGSTATDLQAATDAFIAGIENSVPVIGGPIGPGPGVAEAGYIVARTTEYSGTALESITAGDTTRFVDATIDFTQSWLDRYVPVIGGPIGPGPGVAEGLIAATADFATNLSTSTVRALSGDVTDGAVADYSTRTLQDTQTLSGYWGDAIQRSVPVIGGPIGPGPGVTEVRKAVDGVMSATIIYSDAIARTVPVIGGPIGPGPGVTDPRIPTLPSGF